MNIVGTLGKGTRVKWYIWILILVWSWGFSFSIYRFMFLWRRRGLFPWGFLHCFYWILLGLLRVWQGLFQELIGKVLNTLCVWYSGDFSMYIPGTVLEASYCNLWGEVFLSQGISRTSWCWTNSSADVNEKSTESVDHFSILYCERWGMSLSERCINILLTPCYRLKCCT